jgi:drug/metabolite transporter (DMT)-like permease
LRVVAVTLLAALFMQVGFILWKVAADRLPRSGGTAHGPTLRAFLSSPPWLLGWLFTVGGWLLFIKAMALGELTVVQPLMALGNLLSVAAGIAVFRERLGRRELAGLCLTLIGATALAAQAQVVEPTSTHPGGLILVVGTTALGLSLLLLVGKSIPDAIEAVLAVAAGVSFGTGAVLTKLLTASLHVAGQPLASTAVLWSPVLYFMILANGAGIALLQSALQRGRIAVVIPVNLASANSMGILGGIVLFDEDLSLLRLGAIASILAGTALLARARTGPT